MAEFPLILTYTSFGAPGCGGISRLAIGLTNRGDIAVIDDLPSEYEGEEDSNNITFFNPFLVETPPGPPVRGSEFRRTGTVPATRGWRGVIEYLAKNEIIAFGTDGDTSGEYPWPDRMHLEGKASVASDLIAVAWSGPPVRHIARALAILPDDMLEGLRARCGPLSGERTIQPLLRILNMAEEMSVSFPEIVARAHRFDFKLNSMLRDVRALGKVIGAEKEAANRRRAWVISPYGPTIDTIIQRWRRANPATSANTQIGQSMRAGSLRMFLEAYVIEHGCLPTGVHKIEKGHGTPFNVDFDGISERRKIEDRRGH
jgi:hypothetical protein